MILNEVRAEQKCRMKSLQCIWSLCRPSHSTDRAPNRIMCHSEETHKNPIIPTVLLQWKWECLNVLREWSESIPSSKMQHQSQHYQKQSQAQHSQAVVPQKTALGPQSSNGKVHNSIISLLQPISFVYNLIYARVTSIICIGMGQVWREGAGIWMRNPLWLENGIYGENDSLETIPSCLVSFMLSATITPYKWTTKQHWMENDLFFRI